jgi:hypothetical protein
VTRADALLDLAVRDRPAYTRAVLVALVGLASERDGGVVWRGRMPDLAASAGVSVRKLRDVLDASVAAGDVRRDRVEGGVEIAVLLGQGCETIRHEVPIDRHEVPNDWHHVPNDRHEMPLDRHDVPFLAGARTCAGVTSPSDTTYLRDPSHPLPPSATQPEAPASPQSGGVEMTADAIDAALSAAVDGVGDAGEIAQVEAALAKAMGLLMLSGRDARELERMVRQYGVAAVVECAPEAVERGHAPVAYLRGMLANGGMRKPSRKAPGAQVNAAWGADGIEAARALATKINNARMSAGEGRQG